MVLTILFSSAVFAQNKAKNIIKLPVFMAGKEQVVDKPISGDLMISGGQVKVTSNIEGDAYVAGGQIDISGTVNGNLIVGGGNITVSGKITKNLIVGGGQIKVEDTANIGGYVLAAGGKVDLLGHVSGPVKVGAGDLVVGEKATIDGNLEADVSKSEVASTAKIVGGKKITIHETTIPEKQLNQQQQLNQWRQLGFAGAIFSFLSKLVILLILIKLFGQKIKQINTGSSFWSSIGLGLVVLIVVPFLALILMVTIVAIPLSFMISGLYLISLYLSGIVTAILVGNLISKKGYLKTDNYYLRGFLGLLLLTLIGLIPIVGGLVKLVVLLVGLGTVFKKLQMFFLEK